MEFGTSKFQTFYKSLSYNLESWKLVGSTLEAGFEAGTSMGLWIRVCRQWTVSLWDTYSEASVPVYVPTCHDSQHTNFRVIR